MRKYCYLVSKVWCRESCKDWAFLFLPPFPPGDDLGQSCLFINYILHVPEESGVPVGDLGFMPSGKRPGRGKLFDVCLKIPLVIPVQF